MHRSDSTVFLYASAMVENKCTDLLNDALQPLQLYPLRALGR